MKHNKILLIAGASVATIALLAMLTYNFRHTQQFLSRYIDPPYLGYVAATGIELSVLALSVAIGLSKWHGMKTGWFWLVLVLVMAVSILANVTEGYREKYGEELVTATFPSIDPFQGIAALLATGGISITVMAVAEIAGRYTVQLATEGTEKKEGTPKSAAVGTVPRSRNGGGTMGAKAEQLILEDPTRGNAEIAKEIGARSASTVSKARTRLREQGKI